MALRQMHSGKIVAKPGFTRDSRHYGIVTKFRGYCDDGVMTTLGILWPKGWNWIGRKTGSVRTVLRMGEVREVRAIKRWFLSEIGRVMIVT